MTAMIAPQRGATGSSQMKEKIPSGYKKASIQQFTPEQMQLFQQMFGDLGPDSFLGKLAAGDQSIFDQIEAPAHRQFAQQQGNIASRFSGMGMGARNSSGFQNTMSQASSDFAQNLQSNRQQMQQQAIKELMGMKNQLLAQKPFENALIQKPQNQTAELIGKLLGAAPGLVASFFGGGSPQSAIKGATSIFSNAANTAVNTGGM